MSMSESQTNAATVWLADQFPNGQECSACGQGELLLSKEVFTLSKLYFVDADISPSSVPLIMTECTTCGHVQLFSAIKAGLLKGR
jgi:hypothetical protein